MSIHHPIEDFAQVLLSWFTQHGRKNLPWQQDKTPYRVWLSEIMLQQTQVKTVIPYYLKFTSHYPDIESLALAEQDDVLHLWTGLGYYARARNLHKTAQIIHQEHQNQFPKDSEGLQNLPGIGRSTAGAILSFAYGQDETILDGNVKRILCRCYQIQGWSGHTKTQKHLWELIEALCPKQNCDHFNQALMDLGSSLCSRSKPDCQLCPLNQLCLAYNNKQTHLYPQSKAKIKKPTKATYLLVIKNTLGEYFLEKRPQKGIWGGLWSFPQVEQSKQIQLWLDKHHLVSTAEIIEKAEFKHTFSHYHLLITPIFITVKNDYSVHELNQQLWFNPEKPLKLGLPAPIKKLIYP